MLNAQKETKVPRGNLENIWFIFLNECIKLILNLVVLITCTVQDDRIKNNESLMKSYHILFQFLIHYHLLDHRVICLLRASGKDLFIEF